VRKLRYTYKILRLPGLLCAFFATWVSATLCVASPSDRLYASVAMGLSCLASSLFHYGAANKMYARKVWDLVEIQRPGLFITASIVAFTGSIAISDWLLPRGCVSIMWFNVVAISLYAQVLSKHWFSKNITIALVCITPILLGWWIGTSNNLVVLDLLLFVFCGHYAREVVKDIQDRKANCGIRVTLPIFIGDIWAQRIAGIMALASALASLLLLPDTIGAGMVGLIMAGAGIKLLVSNDTNWIPQLMTAAMGLLIITFAN